MRASPGTLFAAAIAVVLLACGGTTSVLGGDAGNGDGAGGNGGSGGGSGSSTGGSSGGTSSGSGGSSGGADAGGGPCTSDAQCGQGLLCGFPEADACSATGRCFLAQGAMCKAYEPGCACDGTEINLICNGLPPGYASKPLLYTWQCGQGLEAGAGCTSDSQCGAGLKCCYPCGIVGCHNECLTPDPGGRCPAFP
jgi:hypothetical protein